MGSHLSGLDHQAAAARGHPVDDLIEVVGRALAGVGVEPGTERSLEIGRSSCVGPPRSVDASLASGLQRRTELVRGAMEADFAVPSGIRRASAISGTDRSR